ncbi:hypothetical protein VCHENC02_0193B, partial [Vibrio harveyi]
SEIA